jgi:hypothetical protein
VLVGAAFQPRRRVGGPRSGPRARPLVAPGGSFATGGFPPRGSPARQSQPPAKGKCAGTPAVLGAVWGAWRALGAAARPAGDPAGKPRELGSGPERRRGAGRPRQGEKVGFARRKKHRWRRRGAIPGREQAASSPVLTAVRPPPLNTRMRRPSARREAGKREAEEAEAEPEPGAESQRRTGGASPPATRAGAQRQWLLARTPAWPGSQGPESRLRRGLALWKAPSAAGPGRPP